MSLVHRLFEGNMGRAAAGLRALQRWVASPFRRFQQSNRLRPPSKRPGANTAVVSDSQAAERQGASSLAMAPRERAPSAEPFYAPASEL